MAEKIDLFWSHFQEWTDCFPIPAAKLCPLFAGTGKLYYLVCAESSENAVKEEGFCSCETLHAFKIKIKKKYYQQNVLSLNSSVLRTKGSSW